MCSLLLSSNIPIQQLAVNFIKEAIPYSQSVYGILQYNNGAIQIQINNGEYEEKYPKTLAHFIEKGNNGWYAISDTPFDSGKAIGQTSLEMELKKDYLFVKNIATDAGSMHLLVQLRPFGPNKNTYLLADQKKQFEINIRGVVNKLVQLTQEDRAIISSIAKTKVNAENELEQNRALLQKQGRNYEIAITQFIQLIVNKLEKKYSISIRLTPAFISALKNHQGSFESLENNLERHMQVELNLALSSGETEIFLSPAHLNNLELKKQRRINAKDESLTLGRLAKTYKLLDRYETAAKLVHDKGLSVIGKHIGSHCIPAVSNASITDALNRQSKKVFDLLEKYPERWTIIRQEFKSISNVMAKETERRKQMA